MLRLGACATLGSARFGSARLGSARLADKRIMMSFNYITTVFVQIHGESALPLNPFFRAPILIRFTSFASRASRRSLGSIRDACKHATRKIHVGATC